MIKRNKWGLLASSIVILLPMVIGLLLWSQLPEKIATHWGPDGAVDGWSSKAVAVFVLPLFILAVHWICVAVTAADPKNQNIQGKMLGMVLWVCPVVSALVGTMTYATALGVALNVALFMPLAMGLLFVIIGNYLPKCKQNYTIGIKIPWALNDEENWNSTHRFAGKIWVLGGLLIMATAFLEQFWLFLTITLVMCLAPVLYSYLYYRKRK